MTQPSETRPELLARARRAADALAEHCRGCASCETTLATNPDDAPDCVEGARVYGDWLAALMLLATTPSAKE